MIAKYFRNFIHFSWQVYSHESRANINALIFNVVFWKACVQYIIDIFTVANFHCSK